MEAFRANSYDFKNTVQGICLGTHFFQYIKINIFFLTSYVF